MVARVTIDEHVISEPAIDDSRARRSACRNLARLLVAHGVLVSALTPKALAALVRQIAEPDSRRQWQELLAAVPLRHVNSPVQAIEELECFEAICRAWQPHSDVAVARDGYIDSMAGRSYDDCCRDEASGFELVAYQAVSHASRLARLAESAVISLPVGTDREAIWAEWLAPLARFANQVTIVDRYSAKEEHERGDRAETGLRWLLSKLNEQADVNLRVTVFTAYGVGAGINRLSIRDAHAAIERARGSCAPGRIEEATLLLVEDRQFCHDRWLRFRLGDGRSRHHRLLLGRGLKAFEAVKLSESLNLAYSVGRIPVDEEKMRQSVIDEHRDALSLSAPQSAQPTPPPAAAASA